MPITWRVGDTVPWTVSWTAEQSFSLQDSTDFPGLVDLVQVQKPGQGTPKFAQLNITRQRLGMAGHLCHVCGRRTPRGDRWIFPVASGGLVPAGETAIRYVGNVPPMHLTCARRSRRQCPHLSNELAEPVAFPSEETTLMPRLDVVEGLEALAKTLPSGLKIVYSCFRVYGPRFTTRVERLTREHAAKSPPMVS